MRRAFLCDFDGTVSPADVGARFMRRFSSASDAQAEELLDLWRAGEIGSREVTAIEAGWLTATESDALGFARGFAIDPEFAPFAAEALARGERVEIVSDGLDFYVREMLARAGVDLPWSANATRFAADRMSLEFGAPAGCGRCGNCKAAHVERLRAGGCEVVLIGDGFSDRCGARVADRVVARDELLAWCRDANLSALAFSGFADLGRTARAWAANDPPSRRLVER